MGEITSCFRNINNIIKEQLKLNVVEKVPSSETNNFDQVGNIHYLPHRPVIKDDRVTSKVRIVFDASLKIEEHSLNDCLHPGPSLTEPLLSVILRFPANKIAFIADIEKLFLQISLKPDHRDFVRFLWNENENEITSENISQSKICDYRICHVLFRVTSSPFLLTSTISKYIKIYNNVDPKFVEQFFRSLHADDLNIGSENIHDCDNFYNKAKARLDQASFNLRKFQSNSSDLEYLINGEINQILTKVLGLIWEKQKYITFSFKDCVALIRPCPTERQLLSFIASVYDPLGLINPFVFR